VEVWIVNASKKKRKLNKNEQARIAREIGKPFTWMEYRDAVRANGYDLTDVQIRNRMHGLYKCKKIGYVHKPGGTPYERISQYMYCGTYPPEKGD
jgi:hypothetical protein